MTAVRRREEARIDQVLTVGEIAEMRQIFAGGEALQIAIADLQVIAARAVKAQIADGHARARIQLPDPRPAGGIQHIGGRADLPLSGGLIVGQGLGMGRRGHEDQGKQQAKVPKHHTLPRRKALRMRFYVLLSAGIEGVNHAPRTASTSQGLHQDHQSLNGADG